MRKNILYIFIALSISAYASAAECHLPAAEQSEISSRIEREVCDTTQAGSRTEIENDFITRAKESNSERRPFGEINHENLVAYGDDLYILPGESYQNKNINRNAYFKNDEQIIPVWTTEHPLESISDLFIFPSSAYSNPQVEITVLKHEYGEKETFSVPLSHLLATAEEDGCVPFWGVEKYENGILEGALFLYNRKKGYDHVLKIECKPVEVINNNAAIKARASLFIPTNNVKDLFAPYIKKSEEEKIKYDKK